MRHLYALMFALTLVGAAAGCDETEAMADGGTDGAIPMADGGEDAGPLGEDGSVSMDGGPPPADGGSDAGSDGGDGPPPRGTVEVLTGETATGFVDGTGSLARMNGIAGAAISPDGSTIYASDTFNSLMRRIDVATGAVTTIVGAPGETAVLDGVGTDARVSSPRGTGIAPDGSAVYFADSGTIRRIALPSLEVTTLVGVSGMLGYEDGVADEVRLGFLVHDIEVSADGATAYLADRSNRVIRALDIESRTVTTVAGFRYTGAVLHVDGVGEAVRLSGLGGLARVGDVIYFADTFNQCIRRFDPASGEVSTIAGDPTQQGNADGTGAAATFDIPQQLSSDGEHLYVMGFNGTIRRVRIADGVVDTILGDAEDVRPVDGMGAEVRLGVSFGPSPIDPRSGTLYFNDRDANSFRAVNLASLNVSTVAGSVEPSGARDGAFGDARFNGPAAIACTDDGRRCYLSDARNHTIRALDLEAGQVSTLAGRAGEPDIDDGAFGDARFAGPSGLALHEASGRLFVADSANHTVRILDLVGETVSTLAGEPELDGFEDGVGSAARFHGPTGLALSADGETLFVTESGNRTVRRVEVSTATVSLLAGSVGTAGDDDGVGSEATFRRPGAIALSPDGSTLFLADRDFSGNVIRTIDLATREVSTLVGVPGERGIADGDFEDARLNGPWDLLFTPEGHLLVAELRNGVVRRIDLTAETVAVWLGDGERIGNLPFGRRASWEDTTLYFPAALARAGDDLLILAEDAVIVARPDGAW